MAAELYLDLLKRVLTNSLFAIEPNVEASPAEFTLGFLDHYIHGPAISMLPIARLENIQTCVIDVIRRNVSGDLVEAGVWRGGATIFMRAILAALEEPHRCVWVADSLEGLPQPDAERFPIEAKAHEGPLMAKEFRHFAVAQEEVAANFAAFNLLDDRVKFLKGWFKDTLAVAPIDQLAVLRMDGDYYESTMDTLRGLYDKVSVGGYVIVDDYGEDEWTNCRQAVDEFRSEHHIADPMIPVDRRCFYWQRT